MELAIQNRQYWDELTKTLTKSLAHDIQSLKLFLNEGTKVLGEDPKSLEDITESTIAKDKISEQMNQVCHN